MVHLYEDENRAQCIHLLEYVDQEELDEVVELVDDDVPVELVDMLDNDVYQLEDNELPLEVDNNLVELDKDHLMWPEEYDVDILHYDAVVQDNNEEE